MEPRQFVERRQLERVERAIPIRFSIASEKHEAEYDAVTVDWSSHGIRIDTAVPLMEGEQLIVMAQGDTPGAIPARVAWVGVRANDAGATAGLELLYSMPV